MAKTPKPTEPLVPLIRGRFAVYETPDGGYHLSYRPDNAAEDEHVQIPGVHVTLMRRISAGKGGLMRLLKAVS